MLQGDGFAIKERKFDFFFGRVTSSPRNAMRSQQNLADLQELGINEVAAGRERLLEIFAIGLQAPIVKEETSAYGTTISRKVEIGNKGAIEVSYFYRDGNMNVMPEISTIIPKIYRS